MLTVLRAVMNCSWSSLWKVWLSLLLTLLYVLRVPVMVQEMLSQVSLAEVKSHAYIFVGVLTSVLSSVLLRYCKSHFDAATPQPLRTLFSTNTYAASSTDSSYSEDEDSNYASSNSESYIPGAPKTNSDSQCKIVRNPMNLLRGAEYNRFTRVMGREALAYYDMNLSAQDHQNYFTCESDIDRPDYEIMHMAWRERDPVKRLQSARKALEMNCNCATAMILLAEESADTVVEANAMLRVALKAAEQTVNIGHSTLYHSSSGTIMADETISKRDINVVVYIRRRLAMCCRRLGKVKEAVKLMRELIKDYPTNSMNNVQNNLVEALLELFAYNEVQTLLSKLDELNFPKTATTLYTLALLKVRCVADRFSADVAAKKGLTPGEMAAVESVHRAVEFNPHVPKYLLEMKPLIFPPEHFIRRGDSEAISYAFWHLQHWNRIEGALDFLRCTWEGTFRMIPHPLEKGHMFCAYPVCVEALDRELLPPWHDLSVYPKKEVPLVPLFVGGFCTGLLILIFLLNQYPRAVYDQLNTAVKPFYWIQSAWRQVTDSFAYLLQLVGMALNRLVL